MLKRFCERIWLCLTVPYHIRQADRLRYIIDHAVMPTRYLRDVERDVRNGRLRHPLLITRAMQTAMILDREDHLRQQQSS